jgi:hypothetical protein
MKRASAGLVVQSALDAPSFRVPMMQRVLREWASTALYLMPRIFAVYPGALSYERRNTAE